MFDQLVHLLAWEGDAGVERSADPTERGFDLDDLSRATMLTPDPDTLRVTRAPAEVPHSPASRHPHGRVRGQSPERAGVAQLAERQPSKLHVAGSRPVSRSTLSPRPTAARSPQAGSG